MTLENRSDLIGTIFEFHKNTEASMIERYSDLVIACIWAELHKLKLWEKTELAAIKARVKLGMVSQEIYDEIEHILLSKAINLRWWKKMEEILHHDLNAFIKERLRFLPKWLQIYLHQHLTSYDTEEPAFGRMLQESVDRVNELYLNLEQPIMFLARKYRFTFMNGRTHGQEAELQSFGKRCLTWLKELRVAKSVLDDAAVRLRYSKLSGAIGSNIDPSLEREALSILGFEVFSGATQIMPRIVYAPVAAALAELAQVLDKIAMDIRLGARSGRPIYQEPFAKKQTGSSAMPHKKNTISCEKIEGLARLARAYAAAIMENIKTWEERAIEQSCVERVAWPDLFHVVCHALETLTKVLKGLVVYPDNMLQEIYESRGCYASNSVKELLKKLGQGLNLSTEDAYRCIQLASFNAFEVSPDMQYLRSKPPRSGKQADALFLAFPSLPRVPYVSIQTLIPKGMLRPSSQTDHSAAKIRSWNIKLRKIFSSPENLERWNGEFLPSHLTRYEKELYSQILGE